MTSEALEHHVWFVTLDELDPVVLARAFPSHAGISEQLAGLPAGDLDVRRKVTAHSCLRLLLSRLIGVDAALAPFAAGYAGKPQLAINPGAGPIDFSLSHTGSVALIGIARNCCIGVDIERPRRITMTEDRRRQIIDVAETISGRAIAGHYQGESAVLAAWVRLEAAAKATGEGMGRLLTRSRIVGSKADFAEVSQSLAARTTVFIRDLKLPEPYFGAMATNAGNFDLSVRIFSLTADVVTGAEK